LEPDRKQWALTLTYILRYWGFISIGVGNLLLGHPVPYFKNGKIIFQALSLQKELFSEVGNIGGKVRE
jgi:hypothetical protein